MRKKRTQASKIKLSKHRKPGKKLNLIKNKSKLNNEQLKLAQQLKVKLAENQLQDQLQKTQKSSNKAIFILSALLLVTLSLALSFLNGAANVSPDSKIDSARLISYKRTRVSLPSFTIAKRFASL